MQQGSESVKNHKAPRLSLDPFLISLTTETQKILFLKGPSSPPLSRKLLERTNGSNPGICLLPSKALHPRGYGCPTPEALL